MTRNFALPGRSPVYASDYAVATSHALATNAALGILKEGGNAVDAAIAASACLCVVEPHMTGLGGDCFAIIGEADGTLHGLNGSGRSAAKANLDWYLDNGFTSLEETSPHAITTPGSVRAWEAMHQKFGRTDFTRLFADAIHYAEEGFAIAPRVAKDWAANVDKLKNNEAASANLLKNGTSPEVGEKFYMPLLAKTLREVAIKGAAAIYQGAIAEDIADTVQGMGGFLSEEDLAGVSADWVDLISTDYQGHTLHEIPPNGQGLTAIMLVKLLAKLKNGEAVDGVERAHLEMELGRISYVARDAYIADKDHMNYSVEQLLSDGHIDQLAALYNPQAHNPNIALPDPTGSDTIYLSVVDRDGMAVSFINSVFNWFGSGIMAPNSGIILQNRGSGFNLIRGHANSIGPSKRPFHTIIPAMVTKNGKVSHSYGVMGGSYQAMGHAHVLSNMLDYGMDPQQALDDPRMFWDDQGVLQLEDTISQEVQSELETKGHVCTRGAVHGGGQIIQIDHKEGVLIAGSDPRKDGMAGGW